MADENRTAVQEAEFVDESGRTSMEPEGVGHAMGKESRKMPRGGDRDQGELLDDPTLERGMRPAEGDGYGAPD